MPITCYSVWLRLESIDSLVGVFASLTEARAQALYHLIKNMISAFGADCGTDQLPSKILGAVQSLANEYYFVFKDNISRLQIKSHSFMGSKLPDKLCLINYNYESSDEMGVYSHTFSEIGLDVEELQTRLMNRWAVMEHTKEYFVLRESDPGKYSNFVLNKEIEIQ